MNIYMHENKLQIDIEDNGIGMVKAMEIKQKKRTYHKSVGIDITKDRLQLFAQNRENNFLLNFENLGTTKNSKGTKVTIGIPLDI